MAGSPWNCLFVSRKIFVDGIPTSAARNLRNRLYEDQEDISPLRPAWEGPKLVGLVSLDDILDLLSEGFAEIGRLMRNEAPSSLAEL